MNIGYQLLDSSEEGEGVFATKRFNSGDVVMIGTIKEHVKKVIHMPLKLANSGLYCTGG